MSRNRDEGYILLIIPSFSYLSSNLVYGQVKGVADSESPRGRGGWGVMDHYKLLTKRSQSSWHFLPIKKSL